MALLGVGVGNTLCSWGHPKENGVTIWISICSDPFSMVRFFYNNDIVL